MFSKNVLKLSLFLTSFLLANSASAGLASDVQGSISAAGAEALAVGGYVIGSVVSLLIVTLVLKMVRRPY